MSTAPLADRVGLDSAARVRRFEYLRLTEDDLLALHEIRPFLERISDSVVDSFYKHLLAFEDTARFLRDPDLVSRLHRVQRAHFVALADVSSDAEYFESRLAVGMAHARIELPPHLYMGAYLVQMQTVEGFLFEEFREDPGKLGRYRAAIWKAIMLDIQLATDAYIYGGFVERSLADAHAREAERARHLLAAKEGEELRREELLNMVIHDIRSPVTAMMATARAALRRYDDVTTAPGRQFSRIEESGANALRIIDDILTHSRLINGRMPLRPEPFDVADTVRGCVEELKLFATQTGHKIGIDCADDLRVSSLDPVLVRRIVSNLLVNALRHTPAGSNVSVVCRPLGDTFEVRVEDDGPGIPRHIRERIFNSDGGRLRRSEGAYVDSGLGLPFCWLASESLGGHIRIEDIDSRGACFVLELPSK